MAKPKVHIFKIGGNVIDHPENLNDFLSDFSNFQGLKILVHGGGKIATKLSDTLGIKTEMYEGRRITSKESLEVVTMVYAGLINKNIVANLQGKNLNAIGLSGVDGNLVRSVKRPIKTVDFGWVGDITEVNTTLLDALLKMEVTPVFCSISHDKSGNLLNVNADTFASEIAIALSEIYDTQLIYIFEKQGVLNNVEDDNSVITQINPTTYHALKDSNIIQKGMLPKLDNCFHALEKNVGKVLITSPQYLKNNQSLYTNLTL